jgi:hypothetical protein
MRAKELKIRLSSQSTETRAKELQIHLSSFYLEPFKHGQKLGPYKTTMSKKVENKPEPIKTTPDMSRSAGARQGS